MTLDLGNLEKNWNSRPGVRRAQAGNILHDQKVFFRSVEELVHTHDMRMIELRLDKRFAPESFPEILRRLRGNRWACVARNVDSRCGRRRVSRPVAAASGSHPKRYVWRAKGVAKIRFGHPGSRASSHGICDYADRYGASRNRTDRRSRRGETHWQARGR
jgi:hypothetical protein